MAREQQRAEHRQVARRQRVRHGEDARVLGDDVPRARDVAHLLGRGVAQRRRGRATPRPPRTRRGVTRTRSPRACGARPQCTTSTAIDGGIATGVTVGGAAVDQQRVPGPAEERGELVHQPTGHAGGGDLGRRRQPGGVDPVEPASPARSARARVSATASAELDDSPEPTGTVESTPARRRPPVRPGRSAPARHRPRSGPRSAPHRAGRRRRRPRPRPLPARRPRRRSPGDPNASPR